VFLSEIYLHPRAGHSTSATIRDVLLLNFPVARDIRQLRALLTGTPLCEVHGSSHSAIHRQGTLIDFPALDGQIDLAEAARLLPPFMCTPPCSRNVRIRQTGIPGVQWNFVGTTKQPGSGEPIPPPAQFGATESLNGKPQALQVRGRQSLSLLGILRSPAVGGRTGSF
jgi:hypothetical protein